MNKKRDFAGVARGIVAKGKRPTDLDDFLDGKEGEGGQKEPERVRHDGVSYSRTSVQKEEQPIRTEREEFRFDHALAERLRRAAFETRKKKSNIAREAIDRYLQELGF